MHAVGDGWRVGVIGHDAIIARNVRPANVAPNRALTAVANNRQRGRAVFAYAGNMVRISCVALLALGCRTAAPAGPDATAADAALDAPDHCTPPTGDAAPSCGDAGPAHGTQDTATSVPVADSIATTATGTLETTDTVDWYTYTASADIFSTIDPEVSFQAWTIARICVYATCPLACPVDTTPDTAPDGQNGCCSETIPNFQLSCGSSSTTVWMSVQSKQPSMCATCIPYQLEYNW